MRVLSVAVALSLAPVACSRCEPGPVGVAPIPVSTTPMSTEPSVVIDARGRVVVAWYAGVVGGNSEVHARRFEAGAWTDLPGLGDPAENNGPVDVALGAGEEVVAAWAAGKVPSVIRVAVWKGTRWEELPGADDRRGRALLPRVVTSADGRPVVVWWNMLGVGAGAELRVRRWTGAGWTTLPSPVLGPAVDEGRGGPDVALDSNGNPVLAWSAATPGGSSIFVARWDGAAWAPFGASLSRGISEAAGESSHPRLVLAGGRPTVAWIHSAGGRRDVYLRRWTGAAWEELGGSGSGNGLAHGSRVAIASTGSGEPLVAFGDGDADSQDVFLRSWSGGAWIPAPGFGSDRVSQLGTFSVQPSLAWAGGRACVAWTLYNGDRVVMRCAP